MVLGFYDVVWIYYPLFFTDVYMSATSAFYFTVLYLLLHSVFDITNVCQIHDHIVQAVALVLSIQEKTESCIGTAMMSMFLCGTGFMGAYFWRIYLEDRHLGL
jgi:hypothetical protein